MLAGRVFSQTTTPAGLALPIYTTTAICASGVCSLPLFNPPNSNRNVELISFDMHYATGTAAYSAIGMWGVPCQSVATGSPLAVFAQTTPNNNLFGAGNASKCLSSNGASAVTLTTGGGTGAPTNTTPGILRAIGSINLEAITGTAQGTEAVKYTFDGADLVPPGFAIYFAGTLASVALYCMTLTWKETAILPNAG